MVPETGVGADHNWPQRMTMTTTNVEILRQGWLDAASALAPGLDTLPEFLEHGLEAAVIDERLDEQSLLRVVTEVTSAAADSLPAEELYFLTRRLQRAVYEYLLSLDALPEPPPRRDGSNGHPAPTPRSSEPRRLRRSGVTATSRPSPSRRRSPGRAGAGRRAGPAEASRGTRLIRPRPPRPPTASRPDSPSSTRNSRPTSHPTSSPSPSRNPRSRRPPQPTDGRCGVLRRACDPPGVHAVPAYRRGRVQDGQGRVGANGHAAAETAEGTNGSAATQASRTATTPSRL